MICCFKTVLLYFKRTYFEDNWDLNNIGPRRHSLYKQKIGYVPQKKKKHTGLNQHYRILIFGWNMPFKNTMIHYFRPLNPECSQNLFKMWHRPLTYFLEFQRRSWNLRSPHEKDFSYSCPGTGAFVATHIRPHTWRIFKRTEISNLNFLNGKNDVN